MSKSPKNKWMPTSGAVPKIRTIAEELSCSCGHTESGRRSLEDSGKRKTSSSSWSRSSDPTRPTTGTTRRNLINDLGSSTRSRTGGGAAVALEDFDGVEDILAVSLGRLGLFSMHPVKPTGSFLHVHPQL
ncbi:uncharacterized protein LOC142767461 isoform X2 [Rhipicephalus microplus]|uniref:uncharacterized protein LOC142767461 isoform X2 n=1 Tax=Rhipicephalus microplus TaxID=6941 RepID=UPI003F6B36B4